jgi:hypothetical protein
MAGLADIERMVRGGTLITVTFPDGSQVDPDPVLAVRPFEGGFGYYSLGDTEKAHGATRASFDEGDDGAILATDDHNLVFAFEPIYSQHFWDALAAYVRVISQGGQPLLLDAEDNWTVYQPLAEAMR